MKKQTLEQGAPSVSAERQPKHRLPEMLRSRFGSLSDFVLDRLAIKQPNLDAVRIKERGYSVSLGRAEKSLCRDRDYTGTVFHDSSQTESAHGYVNKEHLHEVPEAEAVAQTREFLTTFIDTITRDDDPSAAAVGLADKARNLLEGMTYLTEEDVTRASEGLANYWRGYLDEHADNRVVLISHAHKSSGYVANRALSFLDDAYRERIDQSASLSFYDRQTGRNLAEQEGWLEQYVAHRKIVMVDDWMSTGRQISHEYGHVLTALPSRSDQELRQSERQLLVDHTEINLLVDSEKRIAHGLDLNGDAMVDGLHLPVKAYWAKEGTDTMTADLYGRPVEAGLLVTGSHSSTDDYFEVPCAQMIKVLHDEYNTPCAMPPLTNIERPYRRA